MEIDDIRKLSDVAPFAWSRYLFDQQNDVFVYKQTIGAAAGRDVGNVGWNGDELVAFRLHLPSRVPFHNSPTREIERGNIIVWEQPLAGRMKSEPVEHRSSHGNRIDSGPNADAFGITIVLAARDVRAGDLVGHATGEKDQSVASVQLTVQGGALGVGGAEGPSNWQLTTGN